MFSSKFTFLRTRLKKRESKRGSFTSNKNSEERKTTCNVKFLYIANFCTFYAFCSPPCIFKSQSLRTLNAQEYHSLMKLFQTLYFDYFRDSRREKEREREREKICTNIKIPRLALSEVKISLNRGLARQSYHLSRVSSS